MCACGFVCAHDTNHLTVCLARSHFTHSCVRSCGFCRRATRLFSCAYPFAHFFDVGVQMCVFSAQQRTWFLLKCPFHEMYATLHAAHDSLHERASRLTAQRACPPRSRRRTFTNCTALLCTALHFIALHWTVERPDGLVKVLGWLTLLRACPRVCKTSVT